MRLGVEAALVGDHVVPGDVEVEGGLVVGVGVAGPGSGLAVPGFIDVHIHGYGGVDFATTDETGIEKVSAAITATGVTAFRPSLMSLPVTELMRAIGVLSQAQTTGARVLGAHLEGPFLSKEHLGAHPVGYVLDPDVDTVELLLGAGRVEHVTLAPELPGAHDLITLLVDRGVTVSLGHSDADADEANRAFDLGASALTHVFNGSRPFRHRDPGIIGAALTREGVFVEAILDGAHLSDEATLIVLRTASGRVVAVSDAMAAAGVGDGVFSLGGQEVTVAGGVARLAGGTIASSVLTMDAAFRKLMTLGSSLTEASRATSGAPAELIGRPDMGTLDPGTSADLVVLDAEHRVTMTMVDGVIRHPA